MMQWGVNGWMTNNGVFHRWALIQFIRWVLRRIDCVEMHFQINLLKCWLRRAIKAAINWISSELILSRKSRSVKIKPRPLSLLEVLMRTSSRFRHNQHNQALWVVKVGLAFLSQQSSCCRYRSASSSCYLFLEFIFRHKNTLLLGICTRDKAQITLDILLLTNYRFDTTNQLAFPLNTQPIMNTPRPSSSLS